MVNVEEIKSIIKFIEAEPEKWDQSTWVAGYPSTKVKLAKPIADHLSGDFRAAEQYMITESCATQCCVAGFAIMRAGLAYRGDLVYNPATGEEVGNVAEVAADLLRLNEAQASVVFSAAAGSGISRQHKIHNLKEAINRVTGITFDD